MKRGVLSPFGYRDYAVLWSGAFVSNSDDSVCGSQGCKLRFLRWSAWGL